MYVVVLGDLNARVGDVEIEGVVGKYGVPGRNESGESLIQMCLVNEMSVGNTFFKKKDINKYTWVRVNDGQLVDRAMMDYVLMKKKMIGRVLDVHVFRGEGTGMSDHFMVKTSVRVAERWRKQEGANRVRKVLNVRGLDDV